MIGFVTTKKRISTLLLVVLLSLVLVISVIWKTAEAKESIAGLQPATDILERVAFIENMGYTVNENKGEQSGQIEIPYIFSDVYKEYQKLQNEAGYDLTKYSGKEATLYTYQLDYPNRNDVYAHLIVYNDAVIGGDISALSVSDGFLKPLAPENLS